MCDRPFVHFIGDLEELKNKKYTELPRKPSVQSPGEIKTSTYKLLFSQQVRYIHWCNYRGVQKSLWHPLFFLGITIRIIVKYH